MNTLKAKAIIAKIGEKKAKEQADRYCRAILHEPKVPQALRKTTK